MQGASVSGAAISAHISSVASAGFGMEIRIQGTGGYLAVTSDSPNPPPMMPFTLRGARAGRTVEAIDVPDRYDCTAIPTHLTSTEPYPGIMAPRATLASIANLYERLGNQIRGRGTMTPSFTTAVEMHHLLDAIDRASVSGVRQIIRA